MCVGFTQLIAGLFTAFLIFPGSLVWAGDPPEGFLPIIKVRFSEGTDVSVPQDAVDSDQRSQIDDMYKLFTLSDSKLDSLRAAGSDLPDLKLWFVIELVDGADPGDFLNDLQDQANVDFAEFTPGDTEPPRLGKSLFHRALQATPDFEPDQRYLDPAPDGIDAEFAWNLTGGEGAGIRVYDIEYGWRQTHEDLAAASGVVPLVPSGGTHVSHFEDHGTAVLSILIGTDNGFGVKGVCFRADIGLPPQRNNVGGTIRNSVGDAILRAVDDANPNTNPGDVILLECQTPVCDTGNYGPQEWEQDVFDAIQTAIANRITVVEAAGNGGVDLDIAACNNKFDRATRDSGAIIVGAGQDATSFSPRTRLGSSSYGSRVDVQGWGGGIAAAGYGFLWTPNPPDVDREYTVFGSTSGASAIVAGAATILQSIAFNLFGTPLLPFQTRELLRDTGTPQTGANAATENIGPLPDLRNAYAQLTTGQLDLAFLVDVTGSFSDDIDAFKAEAKDVVQQIRLMNANTRFGLATFRDYPISPWGDPGDEAYTLLQDLDFDENLTIIKINDLTTGGGADKPESQLTAIYQLITGDGQTVGSYTIPANQNMKFRSDAFKVIMLWTDAPFHTEAGYPGNSIEDVADAIADLNRRRMAELSPTPTSIRIIAITRSTNETVIGDLEELVELTGAIAGEGGVDCDGNGTIDIEEGDPIVCPIAGGAEGIGRTVVSTVEGAVVAAKPVALCSSVTTTADTGACTASSVSIDNGSYNPDGASLMEMRQSPPNPYPVGTTPVSLTVANENFRATCTETVTVTDDEHPVITAPSDETDVQCDAVPAAGTPSTSDNCEVSQVNYDGEVRTDGICEDSYTLERTWTAVDPSDNSASDNQNITVVDTNPPSVSCNVNDISPDDVNQNSPAVFTPTATDCDPDPVVLIQGHNCYKVNPQGKEIPVNCKIESVGATASIFISGGVGTHIDLAVSAGDRCSNNQVVTCSLMVVEPPTNP